MQPEHKSVMTAEVLQALAVNPGDVVVDATIGGAGHFARLLALLGENGTLIGIDLDPAAVERARAVVSADRRGARPAVHLIVDDFRNLERILANLNISAVDKILFDLGWSGYQLSGSRGFSFQKDEPLVMLYGEGGRTAAEIINSSSESDLADLFYQYGQERYARGIAKAIVRARRQERVLTTGQLVQAVEAGTPASYQHGKIHPATKTFQALRIAANDELRALREGLSAGIEHLAEGGRAAVITFHSIEDRVVKQMMAEAVKAGRGVLVFKKPLVPSRQKVLENRRARSAKLRVFAHEYA